VTAPPTRLVAVGRAVGSSFEGLLFLGAGLVLHALGFAGPLFWWAVPFMVSAALLEQPTVQLRLAGGDLRRRAAWRLALMAGAVATSFYLIGWGPLLSFAFVGVTVLQMRVSEARVWRPALVGTVIALGAGQAAVAASWVPNHLPGALAQVAGWFGAFVSVALVRVVGVLGEQREAAEAAVRASEERFRALVQDSCDVIALLDTDATVMYVSPAVHTLIGVEPAELVGSRFSDWIPPDDLPVVAESLADTLTHPGRQHRVEVRLRHSDGRDRWVEATVRNLTDNPAVRGLVANLRDITERRAVVDRLNFDANHDALTGLLNRAAFLRDLHDAFAAGPVAVLFVDLDGLKGVNDTLGHGAGDAAIIAAAGMLQRGVLGSDVVGRLGGDEFGIVLPGVDTIDRAVAVAERVLVELDRPVRYDDHTLRIRASVGVAVTDVLCPDADTLLNHADAAMYRAKRHGRHSYDIHLTDVPAWR
jgi:diguanylate cyclase (GGDEF)-like protein/PAS domain S-box-containing protein